MNKDKSNKSQANPEKAYRDELNDRGNELRDNEREGNARDRAKIEKAISGKGQKIDSVHPDDLDETQ